MATKTRRFYSEFSNGRYWIYDNVTGKSRLAHMQSERGAWREAEAMNEREK